MVQGSGCRVQRLGCKVKCHGIEGRGVATLPCEQPKFISQKVFIKFFCKSQFRHKSVNLFFILVIIKDTSTDLCGN